MNSQLQLTKRINQYEKNVSKIRAHDAIVGVLYLISAGLTLYTSNLNFVWIAVVVVGLQLIRLMTKFCPVYFILNKLMPNTDPIQNGK